MSAANARRLVVLGVTGSIAAVKAPEIVRLLVDRNCDVRCVLTHGAEQFVSPLALATFSGASVVSDVFGPESFQMPHLKLADAADLLLIAPLSTAVLGKMAAGISDDMVTLTYISTKAPTLVAPAMHPPMWEHPSTQDNVAVLKKRGVYFEGPVMGPLADKSHGEGRMAEPEKIVAAVDRILSKRK